MNLTLYSTQNIYSSISTSDGTFIFNNITGIRNEQLPTGYTISNNYPNPFNPITRMIIALPKASIVKIDIYNLIGENVNRGMEKYFGRGSNYIDIELRGLPNGVYFARISLDDKHSVVRKMMLVYGSQHLITNDMQYSQFFSGNSNFNKIQETTFDSLVAENIIIGSKTFASLPNLDEGTVDFGNLIIERYCDGIQTVTYEGKTYNTVKIGDQCWLRENLDVGTMIASNSLSDNQIDDGMIEKYCYNNDPVNCETYGGLYQWNEAMQYDSLEGAKGICPSGWHIPTNKEQETLRNIVGWSANALKAIGEGSGYGVGTNTSGFSALFAGYRSAITGGFNTLGSNVLFWISADKFNDVFPISLRSSSDEIQLVGSFIKAYGFCVRCVKD